MPTTNDELHTRLKRVVYVQSFVILALFLLLGGMMIVAINIGQISNNIKTRGAHNSDNIEEIKSLVATQCGKPTVVVQPGASVTKISH